MISLASALLPLLALAPATQEVSVHVPMTDGTRLAVDVYLPEDHEPGERVPALFELTRYWRASEDPATGAARVRLAPLDRTFLANGYALVKVDVRGSGASFGSRTLEYGPQEVRDNKDLIDWVIAQDWSDGQVGAYGTSYTGTTAELFAASGHPAVKAVIPGWSDFDLYTSPGRPYGLYARTLIDRWGQMVGWMDDNDTVRMGGSVRRVAADTEGRLRDAAVREHRSNVDVAAAATGSEFRDQPWVAGGPSWAEGSSLHWKAAIEASGVPMLVFASWLDAGTAGGALERLRTYSNPQHLVLLASSHGGGTHASPFVVGRQPQASNPSVAEQIGWRLAFFDHHLKGARNDVPNWPRLRYFHMGAEELRESDVWPPEDIERRRFHLGGDGTLSEDPEVGVTGRASYDVDFGVSTGTTNRWMTQLGGPVLRLDDRDAMDARMLVFESEPFAQDTDLSGTPTVRLSLTANRPDVAVLVYLEDVAPDGRSRYLTEGGLRSIHRALGSSDATTVGFLPRTYARTDARPLVPGEPAVLDIEFWPVSALLGEGHSLRLAIAGADAETFGRHPSEGDVTFEITWGDGASFLELPLR